jgi:uncharacterized protein YjbI with pentapeptide repeats
MANPELLKLLKEGVSSFNEKRAKFKGAMVLDKATLQDAKATGANFSGISAIETNFNFAKLIGTNFFGAILQKSTFINANAKNADFTGSDIRGSNFINAKLNNAKFYRADARTLIENGEYSITDFSNSVISQEQLGEMIGDSRTLIPNHLTRPTHWSNLKEPVLEEEKPVSKESFVFLSYARASGQKAGALYDTLINENIPMWWDQDIMGGEAWREEIAKNLTAASAVLTLWDENSTQSPAVIEEAQTAQSAGKLVHARLGDTPLPYGFGEVQWIDLRGWDGTPSDRNFQKLLYALRVKLGEIGPEEHRRDLEAANPLAAVNKNGKLGFKDTPPNAPPSVINDPDLKDRLAGLRSSVSNLFNLLNENRTQYQIPFDLIPRLETLISALDPNRPNWYDLEDSTAGLRSCYDANDGDHSWNDALAADFRRLFTRIVELQPLLQPEQIPIGEQGAKPAVPDPVIKIAEEDEFIWVTDAFRQSLAEEETQAVFDEAAMDTLQTIVKNTDLIANASIEEKPTLYRRIAKGILYTVGATLLSLSGGVIVNLLTSSEAARVLASRWQVIYDAILKFFI